MAAISICSDFGAPKITSDTISNIYHDAMGLDSMTLIFGILSFKLAFPLSSFTFIRRLFSSSSLSAIRVVSFAYLRLLIVLPAILIPPCVSSSPAFKLKNVGETARPFRYDLNQIPYYYAVEVRDRF